MHNIIEESAIHVAERKKQKNGPEAANVSWNTFSFVIYAKIVKT